LRWRVSRFSGSAPASAVVALFIPVFPIARYRVIKEGGGQYRFLGKVPLRKMDRWHLGLALAAIVGAFVVGNIDTGPSSSSSFGSSSSNRVSSPAPTWSSNNTAATVPYNSVNSQLSNLKAQIEAGRSRQATLVKQLQPVMDELENLKEQIQQLKTELGALDQTHNLRTPIDVASYNSRVDVHNSLVARQKALFLANKADLQALDDLEKQDSVLVDHYNALLKR